MNSADGSIAALLGASPGASTAVAIMIDLIHKCFPEKVATEEWQSKLKAMIPSFGKSLLNDKELFKSEHVSSSESLGIVSAPIEVI